jgi:hypothetical protein
LYELGASLSRFSYLDRKSDIIYPSKEILYVPIPIGFHMSNGITKIVAFAVIIVASIGLLSSSMVVEKVL